MDHIQFQSVSKTYRNQTQPALLQVNLTIPYKQKVGLVGENGSGKTTMLRLLLNLLRPDEGTIKIFNGADMKKTEKFPGYLPEDREGLENFTAQELLSMAAGMNGVNQKKAAERIPELLHWVGLESHKDELLAGFSKGMRQRALLAAALVHQPAVLLLDEPFSGLDPDGQFKLRQLLKQLQDVTLLLASHNLTEVENICERVIILKNGQIKEDALLADNKQNMFSLTSSPQLLKLLKNFPDINYQEEQSQGGRIILILEGMQSAVQSFLAAAEKEKIPVENFRSHSALELLYRRHSSTA
ncbi:MAG: ABC transporter ATP-binding protein [Calditrichia bacterium]